MTDSHFVYIQCSEYMHVNESKQISGYFMPITMGARAPAALKCAPAVNPLCPCSTFVPVCPFLPALFHF